MTINKRRHIKCCCGERFADVKALRQHQATADHRDRGEAYNL